MAEDSVSQKNRVARSQILRLVFTTIQSNPIEQYLHDSHHRAKLLSHHAEDNKCGYGCTYCTYWPSDRFPPFPFYFFETGNVLFKFSVGRLIGWSLVHGWSMVIVNRNRSLAGNLGWSPSAFEVACLFLLFSILRQAIPTD